MDDDEASSGDRWGVDRDSSLLLTQTAHEHPFRNDTSDIGLQ